MAQKKKLTLYFPEELIAETKRAALRQDRSLSWVLQMAWLIARDQIEDLPSLDEFHPELVTEAH